MIWSDIHFLANIGPISDTILDRYILMYDWTINLEWAACIPVMMTHFAESSQKLWCERKSFGNHFKWMTPSARAYKVYIIYVEWKKPCALFEQKVWSNLSVASWKVSENKDPPLGMSVHSGYKGWRPWALKLPKTADTRVHSSLHSGVEEEDAKEANKLILIYQVVKWSLQPCSALVSIQQSASFLFCQSFSLSCFFS